MIIDYLDRAFLHVDNIGFAFLYFNYKEYRKPVELLGSLLKQIMERKSGIGKGIRELYEKYLRRQAHPTLDEISRLLQSELCDPSTFYIVIDAIDECIDAKSTLLVELQKLQPILQLLVTARPHIKSVIVRLSGAIHLD